MTWTHAVFGPSHAGYVGAVLTDGSEPAPVYLDPGSGADFRETREVWAYTGHGNRPAAAGARACCACGWRGPTLPLSGAEHADTGTETDPRLGAEPFYEDWLAHTEAVEQQTVPLPRALDELLEQLDNQLTTLAMDAPAAALKAVDAVDRLVQHVGRLAARTVEADTPEQLEALGIALGVAPKEAGARVTHYRLGL
ncbi:hypothetical protein [Streptomyces sp. NPDC004286]|uniref:hypothetical protein n=1 Tax=Streptomyces sp. NPDC004286 TaxID=3364696 RepID=UPI0036B0AEA1